MVPRSRYPEIKLLSKFSIGAVVVIDKGSTLLQGSIGHVEGFTSGNKTAGDQVWVKVRVIGHVEYVDPENLMLASEIDL